MQGLSETVPLGRRSGIGAILARKPLIVLALTVACLPLALLVTVTMPIGPMYWDHYIYLDAANRIFDGQIPSVDFFAPVGGLGYYLFAGWLYLFPNGHPLLLSSWSLMTVTAPLIALVVLDVQKRSPAIAYGLLLPFLFFSLLPFNTGDFYPYPGSDGFGIYNRQICQLLYVLAAALVFVRGWKTLAAVTAFAMLALLFIKVTGVVAGLVLCLMAFLTGRLPLRAALVGGGVFFAAIGFIELTSGTVSAYATDILSLVVINDTSLLPRLLQAASINFSVVLAGGLLGLVLLGSEFPAFSAATRAFVAKPSFRAIGRIADQSFLWMGSFIAAGLLFESQNTGSQAFIFLWPLLLAILIETYRHKGSSASFAIVAFLAFSAAIPPVATVTQKAARAWIGSVNNRPLEHDNLKSMGAVSIRDILSQRAQRLQTNYVAYRPAYDALAEAGELPSFLLYSDFEFQSLWLQSADDAVSAIRAFESANKVRFETIMTIDFTNPFPWLMDRHAPKYIAIGADPYRAVPQPGPRVNEAVAAVDLALYPTCPPTTARLKLLGLYQPALAPGHHRITLTPCYDAFVRNGIATAP
ncbi:hypothetical protein ASE23_06860 [Rhizobium sp. Root73]|uniref:hypothetical protein n=1 Tax=Rhizobium sp. Root1204 TaxID=1736428 RepID=UPI000712D425|nr:hypothetical protein [Rhizobium sp. Root1204]KQV31463.1 hypothetical protein ASC96_08390 [Rhizobium sp. Root1204]KQY11155.1 hypothetical protein ASD36_09095 [Rhizobium sp. Root1334]KRC05149.1 hypothetical protein ASE23_06860 [Rhizobium sp. Root73]